MELPRLHLTRDLVAIGADARALRRSTADGRAVRVHRGAFVDADDWNALDRDGRRRLRILAAASAARDEPVVSHLSAAALWGAPIAGPVPQEVDVLATVAAGTRTEHGFRKHATRFHDDAVRVEGVLVTNLVRTLADVAAATPFVTAVGILDWAFAEHAVTPEQVLADLDRRDVVQGRVRAQRAVAFADARSGSLGESVSRVRIHELGFPQPELQCRFDDRDGFVGIVDFWWPGHRLIGEFDGVAKYVRDEFRGGRTTAEVVLDEKRRENRLRALGPTVARWEWADAWPAVPLGAILSAAGLPSRRRR